MLLTAKLVGYIPDLKSCCSEREGHSEQDPTRSNKIKAAADTLHRTVPPPPPIHMHRPRKSTVQNSILRGSDVVV
jgi:hypothetical protein